VTRDGRTLYFTFDDRSYGRLRRASILPDGSLGPITPVFPATDEPNVRTFDISSDGALLAFSAEQQDQKLSVFVTELPAATSRWLVVDGGTRPRFSPTGREIFYQQGATSDRSAPALGLFMSVPFTSTPVFKLGVPVQIVDESSPDAPTLGGYDIAPDGKRFLMWKAASAAGGGTRVVLLQNWKKALDK
jgi:hypothetical protein